jgi:hypothetical protein
MAKDVKTNRLELDSSLEFAAQELKESTAMCWIGVPLRWFIEDNYAMVKAGRLRSSCG